jgi:hypothetical protein
MPRIGLETPPPEVALKRATQAGLSRQAGSRRMEYRRLHFAARGNETTFICLNSLLEQI